MSDGELQALEDTLAYHDAPLTYDVSEARLFITKIQKKQRATLELRALGVFTEECGFDNLTALETNDPSNGSTHGLAGVRTQHHRSIGKGGVKPVSVDLTADSLTESESKPYYIAENEVKSNGKNGYLSTASISVMKRAEVCAVVKSDWLFDSIKAYEVLPLHDYLVYIGKRIMRPSRVNESSVHNKVSMQCSESNAAKYTTDNGVVTRTSEILSRARAEGHAFTPRKTPRKRIHGAVEAIDKDKAYSSTSQKPRLPGLSVADGVAPLLQQSTSEHDLDLRNDIPEPPEWVKKGHKYACQRSTPINNPNSAFTQILKTIRLTRDLTGDEIGVRAYSTAIATLSAYPYRLTSPREILALPGCSAKIAALFVEWKNNGEHDVAAVREVSEDGRLQVLRLFHNIWGVGPKTARGFYSRGWRDLDDIIENGWRTLTRVQQIGVKFYDEFLEKMPRSEVEHIRDVVHEHVQHVCGRPEGVRTCIVGGYRRGKEESGDADIMVSHLDEVRLLDAIDDIVASLHADKWITHSLGTTRSNSRRGHQTLPYRGEGAGVGFDSLDKAMVVWQDRRYDNAKTLDGKNPNTHRRVDIILSPWRTVGCAVLGWSAGTTFERDLRRYAKKVKNWKFDSSGIRDRATGDVVDIEAMGERSETIEEAERKVFEALGLEYKAPWERCTG